MFRRNGARPMGELEIRVEETQLIVNARGTRLTITYQVSPDGQSLIEHPFWTGDDRNAPISLNEFRRGAWLAATKRAYAMGWINADASSPDDKPKNGGVGGATLIPLVTRVSADRGVATRASNKAQIFCCYEERRIEANENAVVSGLPLQPSQDLAMIERAARALFEYVFARSERLDVKHLWINCDEATKEGFRREAIAALQAAWPLMVASHNQTVHTDVLVYEPPHCLLSADEEVEEFSVIGLKTCSGAPDSAFVGRRR
jgi:hypothetical protein